MTLKKISGPARKSVCIYDDRTRKPQTDPEYPLKLGPKTLSYNVDHQTPPKQLELVNVFGYYFSSPDVQKRYSHILCQDFPNREIVSGEILLWSLDLCKDRWSAFAFDIHN